MLTWPSALKPVAGGFSPFVRSLSGGQALSGFEQVQQQMHDRWSASYTIPMGRDDRIRAMRWLQSSLRGRANTVGVPVFDRVPRPLSAGTAGSPIGNSYSNPTFEGLTHQLGAPVGNSYVNPVFEQVTYRFQSPVGTTVVNPVFAVRWPDLKDTPFEFSTQSDITGSALIEGPGRVRFTPTGSDPAVGQYVTLLSVRHSIEGIVSDGDDLILTISPEFDAALGDQYGTLSGVTGTALVNGINTVRFTPTGTLPVAGQYVTLLSARRLISAVEADGSDRILTVYPGFNAVASDQYAPIAGITGTALIQGLNRVKFTPTGTQPAAGQYVTLLSVRRHIRSITASGSDRILTVYPGFTVAAGTPGTVAATVNANAAINATSIDIHFTTGGPPVLGNRFSLSSRLYEIDAITSLGSGVYRLTIWPWLRAAASSGATANFSTPLCEMRLSSDQEGAEAMRSLDLMRFGAVTLRFDEVA